MRKLIWTTAALASLASVAVLAVVAAGGPAQADQREAGFAGQARAAGLTEDQAQVALPGESTARDLAAARGTVHRCPYRDLCTYTGKNFTGTMHMMRYCREYSLLSYNFESWINNQSSQKAVFRGIRHQTIYTTRAPLSMSADSGLLGRRTAYAKPCP